MRYGNGRIIFEGVREKFNYKVLFIEFVLGVRLARTELYQMISENKSLIQKLSARGKVIPQGSMMHLALSEEDLVLLYDELFFDKMKKDRHIGFVEAKQRTFDDSIVYGKEWVICNTEFLDHSTYYKVVSALGKKQKLMFVHSNNIEKCIRELTAQINTVE